MTIVLTPPKAHPLVLWSAGKGPWHVAGWDLLSPWAAFSFLIAALVLNVPPLPHFDSLHPACGSLEKQLAIFIGNLPKAKVTSGL